MFKPPPEAALTTSAFEEAVALFTRGGMGEHYELEDHRHNVAIWAAARAAQRGLKDFDVETAACAIEACGSRAISADWRCLPEPGDFDARHGGREGRPFGHTVLAWSSC